MTVHKPGAGGDQETEARHLVRGSGGVPLPLGQVGVQACSIHISKSKVTSWHI